MRVPEFSLGTTSLFLGDAGCRILLGKHFVQLKWQFHSIFPKILVRVPEFSTGTSPFVLREGVMHFCLDPTAVNPDERFGVFWWCMKVFRAFGTVT